LQFRDVFLEFSRVGQLEWLVAQPFAPVGGLADVLTAERALSPKGQRPNAARNSASVQASGDRCDLASSSISRSKPAVFWVSVTDLEWTTNRPHK
jgi:hypothetical protein